MKVSSFETLHINQKCVVLSSLGGVLWEKNGYRRSYFNIDLLTSMCGFLGEEQLIFQIDKDKFIRSRSEQHYDLMWVCMNCKVYYDLIRSCWVVSGCPKDKMYCKNMIINTLKRLSDEETGYFFNIWY